MRRYLSIWGALLRYGASNDLAYIGHFWASLSSTVLYVITFVLFIGLLFERLGSFGGLTKNDFLFITLIGQFTFYVWSSVLYTAMLQLLETVRTGAFDLLLLRPVSAVFYTFTSAFRPIQTLFVSIPNILIFCFIVDWSQVMVTPLSVVAGIIVWVCAMTVFATVMFALASPVFTQGDSTDMLSVSFSLLSVTEFPFGQLPRTLQQLSFVVLPALLATSGSGYVILGKTAPLPMVAGALVAGVGALICFNILWKRALNNYSSASS